MDCPLCQKKVSYPGFHKHIFSGLHEKELRALILGRKEGILKYLELKDHSSLPYVIPNPRLGMTTIKLCYGCNSAYYGKGYTKKHTCEHLPKALERLKALVTETEVATQPLVQSADESKSKKEIDKLNSELKRIKDENNKIIEIEQSFIELLKLYKTDPGYNSLMELCQETDRNLHNHILEYEN
jgi:hypothetical protein